MALCGIAGAATKTIDMSGYEYGDGFYLTTSLSADAVTSLISTANLNKTILGHAIEGEKDYVDATKPNDTISKYSAALGIKTWDDRNEFHFFAFQEAGETSGTDVKSLTTATGEDYGWPSNHAMNKLFVSDTKSITGAALTYAFAVRDKQSTVPYGVAIVMTVCYNDGTWATALGQSTFYSWQSYDDYDAYYKPVELSYDDDYLSIDGKDIIKSNNWTYSSIVAANHAALGIPEPTTATLSLLALAGLAARRRRK